VHFIAKKLIGYFPYLQMIEYLGLNLTWATLHFVGWVEHNLGFVGFLRLRRTNLHFISLITQHETQQLPILEPSPNILRDSSRREPPYENLPSRTSGSNDRIKRLGRMIDINKKDRAKRYHKSSIVNIQYSIPVYPA
jgi:hypothetical protein